jgi:hypothetical protein
MAHTATIGTGGLNAFRTEQLPKGSAHGTPRLPNSGTARGKRRTIRTKKVTTWGYTEVIDVLHSFATLTEPGNKRGFQRSKWSQVKVKYKFSTIFEILKELQFIE